MKGSIFANNDRARLVPNPYLPFAIVHSRYLGARDTVRWKSIAAMVER